MKHLKLFDDFFINQQFKIDIQTINYINDHISYEEYESYIFEDINEGIVSDVINWIEEKVINVICTFALSLKNFINKVMQNRIVKRFIKIADKVIGYLKKFKEKYPNLTKFIFVGTILILIILISTQSTEAAEIVKQSDGTSQLITNHTDDCNAAINFIDIHEDKIRELYKEFDDVDFVISDAKTYLNDMKDGKPNLSYSDESKMIAKTSLDHMKSLIKGANDKNEIDSMERLLHSIEEGSKHIFRTW
jgi:hypothetical protein